MLKKPHKINNHQKCLFGDQRKIAFFPHWYLIILRYMKITLDSKTSLFYFKFYFEIILDF